MSATVDVSAKDRQHNDLGCVDDLQDEIVDQRDITFSTAAILKIIGFSSNAQRRPASINTEGQQVSLGFYNKCSTVELTMDQLGGILIGYCIKAKIPIPRGASKQIILQDNSVVLRLITAYQDVPVPGATVWPRRSR